MGLSQGVNHKVHRIKRILIIVAMYDKLIIKNPLRGRLTYCVVAEGICKYSKVKPSYVLHSIFRKTTPQHFTTLIALEALGTQLRRSQGLR